MPPTMQELNRELAKGAKDRGYCLCVVPLRTVVNSVGYTCTLCGERVTHYYYTEQAKAERGAIARAAFRDNNGKG